LNAAEQLLSERPTLLIAVKRKEGLEAKADSVNMGKIWG
jgi:hypothetical protein